MQEETLTVGMMTSDDSTSDAPRRMKKRWSADEDSKLTQLVGKCNSTRT